MSYDVLDRLLTVNAPGHPGGWPISYGYDENSNLTQASTPWGLFTSSYDARDQILTLQDPGYPATGVRGGTTTFTHDARMLLTKQVYPNNAVTTTSYDAAQRLTQRLHSKPDGSEIDHCWINYDVADRPIQNGSL